MSFRFVCRILGIVALTCFSACSSMQVKERVDGVVADVREATAIGFVDVTIDYAVPNLRISGHAYSLSHLARLMRSIKIPGATLIEVVREDFEGISTHKFQLEVVDIGMLRKWDGAVVLKYPPVVDPAELTSNPLTLFPLSDYVFVTAVGTEPERKAAILCPDRLLLVVKKGSYLGKEEAIISEINEQSLTLIDKKGNKRELKVTQGK